MGGTARRLGVVVGATAALAAWAATLGWPLVVYAIGRTFEGWADRPDALDDVKVIALTGLVSSWVLDAVALVGSAPGLWDRGNWRNSAVIGGLLAALNVAFQLSIVACVGAVWGCLSLLPEGRPSQL